ncbi:MAG: ring-cleaving dioxygenase [Armatimonadota bacterium]|nr:ring-cleaving dioxygenase [Armatimonadota bacterium]MDR5703864.1 ring-cleaving dioxygenase [Armatimonadota bacterium]MDR7434876.1 ring-cleaving dioxygenase [Armatimonadota bacterium]
MKSNKRQFVGIHHVTAIAGNPQENLDFYVGILGLRLVKRSVNQDDPGTYHFFYADAVGTPGTDLTFFAWPGGLRGRDGTGQLASVALAIPSGSMEYWMKRLADHGVPHEGPYRKFDEEVITFSDVHGQALELVAAKDSSSRPWEFWADSPIPAQHAIRGIHGVVLKEASEYPTASFLTEHLGFRLVAEDGGRKRFAVGRGGSGAWLDLLITPYAPRGRVGVGTIHHVAWRTPSDEEQKQWWQRIRNLGVPISDIIDRFWFRSVYFPEPGGALFEIATDGPGFMVDQAFGELGTRLVLPPWLEPHRAEIERALLPIHRPEFYTESGRIPTWED